VGLRQWLASPGTPTTNVEAALVPTGSFQTVSPGAYRGLLTLAGYTSDQLPAVVTREDALSVPAFANGHRLLTSLAGQLPLRAYRDDGGEPTFETRTFLEVIDPDLPPGWSVSRTVDSLLFTGQAFWYVKARWSTGYPRFVQWVDPGRVKRTEQGAWIDSTEIDPADLIVFYGLQDGVLRTGAEAIATALANVRQVRRYADNPLASSHLVDAEGNEPLEAADARDFLQAYTDAVKARGHAYLGGLRLETVGWSARDLQMVEVKQQDAVEMARILGLPGKYVLANEGGSSLTYSNLQEVRRDLIDMAGAALLTPIEQRLSMGDVSPGGTRVKFDADSFFLQITPDQPDPQPAQDAANQGVPLV